MTNEFRLHGRVNDSIEYYATAAGNLTSHHHFYQATDKELRFFAPGNEIQLTETGVKQLGNGGSFCEYMFGVEQPLSDLAKSGIVNRLTLLGAGYNESGELVFGEQNRNEQTYEQVFFEGHAVFNCFFFIDGLTGKKHSQKQEQLLIHLGKSLKRLANLNLRDDSQLVTELLNHLPEKCTIYLIRLINTLNRRYLQEFQKLYYQHRSIPDEEFTELQSLANDMGIDRYQQERIRVDVMYRHRDNYRIIDEYKKILIECHHQGVLGTEQHARLTRLKTLSVRNKIPSALFLTLDDQLKVVPKKAAVVPQYIVTTEQVLKNLFQSKDAAEKGVDAESLEKLLFAKQAAHRNRDHTFEQLLLETGKVCDEKIRDGASLTLLENFSYIITFFDRFDSTSSYLGQMAFMEGFRLNEDILRSLLGNQLAFDEIKPGLFGQLFFDDILDNGYLGRFGRRKLVALQTGLEDVAEELMTLNELDTLVKQLDAEERLYNTVLKNAKERIRNRYSRFETQSEQERLFSELNDELLVRGIISDLLDPKIFHSVIYDIKKEAIYLHNLLPEIIATQDKELREDFLSNSGLDRFYVEELERDYFTRYQIDLDQLHRLRSMTD